MTLGAEKRLSTWEESPITTKLFNTLQGLGFSPGILFKNGELKVWFVLAKTSVGRKEGIQGPIELWESGPLSGVCQGQRRPTNYESDAFDVGFWGRGRCSQYRSLWNLRRSQVWRWNDLQGNGSMGAQIVEIQKRTLGFTGSDGGFLVSGCFNRLLLRERLTDIDSSRRGVGGQGLCPFIDRGANFACFSDMVVAVLVSFFLL